VTNIKSWIGMAHVVAIALATSGLPSIAADLAKGEQLARRWCSSCHLVAGNQSQANPDVPSFLTIARVPNFGPEKIVFFLLEPHPKMPDLALSRGDAADIAAYINSLVK
jgi:mono/diheme cytochrome c family protein